MNKELRAVVIDDDNDRIIQIMDVMPDYVNAAASRFEKEAQKLIARADGTTTDLLIMYADDPRAISLYLFDWMKKDSDRLGLRNIPVVIYTDDAYSDRVMEFLEIDDVFIHEGEIDDRNFFSVLSEAIECAENRSDEFYDASLPDGGHGSTEVQNDEGDTLDDLVDKIVKNNPEKLMGQSLFVSLGENNTQRSMVINDEDRMKSVLESIKDSKEKTYQIRLIMNETEADKQQREQFAKNYYSQDLSINDGVSIVEQSLERIKDEHLKNIEASHSGIGEGPLFTGSAANNSDTDKNYTPTYADNNAGKGNESRIIDTSRYNTTMPDPRSSGASRGGVNKKVSLASVFSQPGKSVPKPEAPAKQKVLVVDTDVRTKLSIQYHYADRLDVDYADSSMKAIDYFIQHKPDIVMIEYDMPYINGVMILDSIRRQPNGTNVKAIILLDVTKHSDIVSQISTRPGINGVIYKPFMKEQFIGAMQRCLA